MRKLPVSALLVLSALAAVGCSSKSTASATPAAEGGGNALPAVSGTRLRAKVLTGGGARELVGFHDSERNEDCTFQHAEDGHTRCLPPTATAGQGGSFSDPACQIPVATSSTCAAAEKYAITYRYDGGCGGGVASELRKVLDAAAPLYAPGTNGCVLQPAVSPGASPPAGSATTVALGEVVPWSAFVEAIETIRPGTPVAEKVLVATDGASQHLGFRDEKLGADCTFQLMADGVTRCVPDANTGPVYYADSECTRASLVNDYGGGGGSCATSTTPNLWLEPSPDRCGGARNVYSLRDYSGPAAGDSDTIYTSGTESSGPSSGSSGSSGATVATCNSAGTVSGGGVSNRRAIDANLTGSLPSAARVSTGSGRLVPALVWPPGTDALVPGWHDTERDVDCSFTLASDGKIRCLPTAATATLFFTDGECKSPSLVAVLGQLPCTASATRFARVTSNTCPTTTRVVSLGTDARNLTNASTQTSPGHCPKFPAVNSGLDATEVDITTFVEGVPATE